MKKIFILIFLISLSCTSPGSIVVSSKLSLEKYNKIAVIPEARIATQYIDIADAFLSSIEAEFMKMGFNVLDRENIKKVIAEAELSQALDPAEIGKMLGVQALVFIKCQGMGQTVKIAQLRMIGVDTSTVLITAAYSAKSEGHGGQGIMRNIGDLEKAVARKSADDIAKMFFEEIKKQIK